MPQLRVPPQPSEAEPQLKPSPEHVFGVHPQTLAVPPPPQVWGAVQVPQFRVPPHPSEAVPQLKPSPAHVAGLQALKKIAAWLETPLYVAVMTTADPLHVGPVVAVNVPWVCPCATVTLAGTCASVVLLESATTMPPAGATLVRVTVPVDETPQFSCDGDITSDWSAEGVELFGLIVRFWLADTWLQVADAATVTKS